MLDEQGIDISSPWEHEEEVSILETLWPRLYRAWLKKEQWAGCREIAEEVQLEWNQAQLCLKACERLGSAEPAILSISELRGSQNQWRHLGEFTSRQCSLNHSEHTTLTSWISAAQSQVAKTSAGVSEIPIVTTDAAPDCSNQDLARRQQQQTCNAIALVGTSDRHENAFSVTDSSGRTLPHNVYH